MKIAPTLHDSPTSSNPIYASIRKLNRAVDSIQEYARRVQTTNEASHIQWFDCYENLQERETQIVHNLVETLSKVDNFVWKVGEYDTHSPHTIDVCGKGSICTSEFDLQNPVL